MSMARVLGQMQQQLKLPDCVGGGDIPNLRGVWSYAHAGIVATVEPPLLTGEPMQGPHVLNIRRTTTGTDSRAMMFGSGVPGSLNIKPGRTYVVEGLMYVPSGQPGAFVNSCQVVVLWYDDGGYHFISATSTAVGMWQKFRLQPLVYPSTTHPFADFFIIFLYNNASAINCVVYYDKLSMIDKSGTHDESYAYMSMEPVLFADRTWDHELQTVRRTQIGL